MKTYLIKEIFGPTIQGEGAMCGTATHFVRFSGCNMWNGNPETRADSRCPYCDTDFYKGTKMTKKEIIGTLRALTPMVEWITISGGEPGLQFDYHLWKAIKEEGFKIAIETNGSVEVLRQIDHICVSPKVPFNRCKQKVAHSLKILYPHPNLDINPDDFISFEALNYYLQPIMDVRMFGDDPEVFDKNLELTLKKIYESNGFWKLSPQIHKIIGVR